MFGKDGKSSKTMTFVFNELGERAVKFRDGDTVLETAQKNKLPLDFSCTEGTCGSCRVSLIEAPAGLASAGEVELETKAERGFREDERLACQMTACAGLKVKVPDYN